MTRGNGFEHVGDFKDRCRVASMVMEFAQRIEPLAHWPTAGQWEATRELGQRMHQIGLDVSGLTDRHIAEVQAARKTLPKRMLEAFLALARAIPDPGEGADPEIHLRLEIASLHQRDELDDRGQQIESGRRTAVGARDPIMRFVPNLPSDRSGDRRRRTA